MRYSTALKSFGVKIVIYSLASTDSSMKNFHTHTHICTHAGTNVNTHNDHIQLIHHYNKM